MASQRALWVVLATLVASSAAMVPKMDNSMYNRKESTPQLPLDHPRLVRTRGAGPHDPEQLHLSFDGPASVVVTWVTHPYEDYSLVESSRSLHSCDALYSLGLESAVEWGLSPDALVHASTSTSPVRCYTYDGYVSGALHKASLGGPRAPLPPSRTVYYRVRGGTASTPGPWSATRSFVAPPAPGHLPYRLGVVGDLGQTQDSLDTLTHVQGSRSDSVLCVGDLSYADGDQSRWDSWRRLVQPLVSSQVWQHTVGNHEQERLDDRGGGQFASDWTAYTHRFHSPNRASASPSPLFYSYEAGGVHVVMLATYADFQRGSAQRSWLERDLAAVDRRRTPWVVAALHAPWYSSNAAHEGEGYPMRDALEGVFQRHGVDMVFAGHVHAYERMERVYRGSLHPCAPVFINVGDGGNHEGPDRRYLDPQPFWSAAREPSFGHATLDLRNATHARWEWYRNCDGDDETGDDVWIVRDPRCLRRDGSEADASERNRGMDADASWMRSWTARIREVTAAAFVDLGRWAGGGGGESALRSGPRKALL